MLEWLAAAAATSGFNKFRCVKWLSSFDVEEFEEEDDVDVVDVGVVDDCRDEVEDVEDEDGGVGMETDAKENKLLDKQLPVCAMGSEWWGGLLEPPLLDDACVFDDRLEFDEVE